MIVKLTPNGLLVSDLISLKSVLETRATDGKGALHWAYEFDCLALKAWLQSQGFEPTRDAKGRLKIQLHHSALPYSG